MTDGREENEPTTIEDAPFCAPLSMCNIPVSRILHITRHRAGWQS